MENVELFVAPQAAVELEKFAGKIFELLEIADYVKRESSHYKGGVYFKGVKDDLLYILALGDEEGVEDLPFWISVSSAEEGQRAESLIQQIQSLVNTTLLPNGFRVARIENFGRLNARRINY